MTLDYSKHKNILLQILKDIYSDTSIAPYLGFKGGTATMMFYNLPRNSVDLDLDLLDETREKEVFEKINKIFDYLAPLDRRRTKFPKSGICAWFLASKAKIGAAYSKDNHL